MSAEKFNFTERMSLEALVADEEAYFKQLRSENDPHIGKEQGYKYYEDEQPTFVVREVVAVSSWNFSSTSDICAICREDLMSPCIACTDLSNRKQCGVSIGECRHGFHTHCLTKWLSDSRTTCPIDSKPWKLIKVM